MMGFLTEHLILNMFVAQINKNMDKKNRFKNLRSNFGIITIVLVLLVITLVGINILFYKGEGLFRQSNVEEINRSYIKENIDYTIEVKDDKAIIYLNEINSNDDLELFFENYTLLAAEEGITNKENIELIPSGNVLRRIRDFQEDPKILDLFILENENLDLNEDGTVPR